MRISRIPLFCLFALCLGLPVFATDPAIVVSGVRAIPGWPWGNTVDIYYMVFWEDSEAEVTVSFAGWDGDVNWPVNIEASYLSGDGVDTPVKSGTLMHTIWDAGAALPGFQCENFTVKVIADFVKQDKSEETGGETTGGETSGGETSGGETSGGTTYLVVDLSGGSTATSYPVRYTDTAPDTTSDTCRTTELWLRRIPAGTFTMGSPTSEMGRSSDETQHEVTLTQDYYIGVFECTQKQWTLVMESNPSENTGDTRPVEDMTYNEIRGSASSTAGIGWPTYGHTVDSSSFMGKLQEKTGLTFDLPTEAQWEYACRKKADGTCWSTALNSGKDLTGTSTCSNLAAVGRYRGNDSDGKGGYEYHTKVGSYLPSELGLYDMHGNVCEWVLDRYGSDSSEAVTDPVGPTSGDYQIKRGGSCNLSASDCRAAVRRDDYTASESNDDIGFRIACVFLPPESGSSSGGETSGGETSGGETTTLDFDSATYLVVDLLEGSEATSYPVRYTDTAPDTTSDTCRTTELWLRKIPAGTFTMGSPCSETGRGSDETQHEVTLTQDYYIGVFECTQKQYELVMGSNPSKYSGDTRPVEQVSYNTIRGTGSSAGAGWPTYGHTVDSTSFMGKLQAKTGLVFDLPTEAQWEYACRKKADGTCWTTALNSGKNLTGTETCSNMAEVGRYYGNSSVSNNSDKKGGYDQHTKVGSYLPSELGLYDMHGNVWEWCLDWYDDYPTTAQTDYTGPSTGSCRVGRGGSWDNDARSCRAAYHDNYEPSSDYVTYGFRIAGVGE